MQEGLLSLSDKVVFCIAADRNGCIACHNRKYNQPQRRGDLVWNTAHCRNKRIFNDRTGLASARNQRPFLLQTWRRDMGGGVFVLMKEAAAPITVGGHRWRRGAAGVQVRAACRGAQQVRVCAPLGRLTSADPAAGVGVRMHRIAPGPAA